MSESPRLKQLNDWGDNETVLVARGKTSPAGADPLDPFEAAVAIASQVVELALLCPETHFVKRVKARRERPEMGKGRGYYVEVIFARRPAPQGGNR